MSRISFTDHSVARFIERHAPDLSHEQARTYLESAALTAIKLKKKTIGGQTQWQIPEEHIILVTKPDQGEHIVVTVLVKQEERRALSDQEIEMLLESEKEVAARAAQTKPPPRLEQPGDLEPAVYGLPLKQLSVLCHLRSLEMSKIRQMEKTKRHKESTTEEANKARRALRHVLRYLHGRILSDPEALAAWNAVAAEDPGFLKQDFLTRNGSLPL